MPCVEGESLRSRLDREKQLPLDEALQITRVSVGPCGCPQTSEHPVVFIPVQSRNHFV